MQSIIVLGILLSSSLSYGSPTTTPLFDTPQRVSILGYDGDAMEPFISRDGSILFFNNINESPHNTDIHYALKVDALTFRYMGKVGGINTEALEGVPTMDRNGNFYFTSPRDYDADKSTLFTGRYFSGAVSGVHLLQGNVSLHKVFWFNMDSEVSAGGQTLYFTDNHKPLIGGMDVSELVIARKEASGFFVRDPESSRILANINTPDDFNYAAGISPDELDLYFTRANPDKGTIGIYMASRLSKLAPFEVPQRIDAIDGFTEGPTVEPGNCAIYFHKKVNERFELFRTQKTGCRTK